MDRLAKGIRRTVEVKCVDPKSFVKVMLYMMVPVAVVILLFGVLAALGGTLFGAFTPLGAGIGLIAFLGIVGMLLFEVILVVLFGFFMALVYNFFADKFGGFVMELNEETHPQEPFYEGDGSARA